MYGIKIAYSPYVAGNELRAKKGAAVMTRSAKFILQAMCFGIALGTASCAHEADNSPVVPSSAVQMSSGDKTIAFTAPRDGIVYIRDDTDNRVVYSGDVKKDQTVRYDPDAHHVTLDDNIVAHPSGNNHPHSIYFHRTGVDERSEKAAATESAARPTTQPAVQVPVIRVPLGVQVDVQTQPATGK
jgi:hypothetical protein